MPKCTKLFTHKQKKHHHVKIHNFSDQLDWIYHINRKSQRTCWHGDNDKPAGVPSGRQSGKTDLPSTLVM